MAETKITKAIKDAELYEQEAKDKLREWRIRFEERQRHLDTLRTLNKNK